jgi:hypothetical protein
VNRTKNSEELTVNKIEIEFLNCINGMIGAVVRE